MTFFPMMSWKDAARISSYHGKTVSSRKDLRTFCPRAHRGVLKTLRNGVSLAKIKYEAFGTYPFSSTKLMRCWEVFGKEKHRRTSRMKNQKTGESKNIYIPVFFN
jgi:hypothetical protein